MTDARFRTDRRSFLALGGVALLLPNPSWAASPQKIGWSDLIPPSVPYSRIVAEGDRDEVNDTWDPTYDENGTKLNLDLNGRLVTMPGYMVPLSSGAEGVTRFMLVPYVGACVHVPPPPPNQLIFVTAQTPWADGSLWDAVLVTGRLSAQAQSTEIADSGYEIAAEKIQRYEG